MSCNCSNCSRRSRSCYCNSCQPKCCEVKIIPDNCDAFASAYVQNAVDVSVGAGTDISFTSAGPLIRGIGFSAPSTSFTLIKTCTYNVTAVVYGLTQGTFALFLNGSQVPGSAHTNSATGG